MSSRGHLFIDTDRVRDAAAELRRTADATDEVLADATRAATLAEFPMTEIRRPCLDLAEELDLLATVLATRADQADGHVTATTFVRTHADRLLHSLVDADGATAHIRGDLALAVLVDHGERWADGHHRIGTDHTIHPVTSYSPDQLGRIVDDATAPPILRAAAATVLADPSIVTRLGHAQPTPVVDPDQSINVEAMAALLEKNEWRRAIAPVLLPEVRSGAIDPLARLADVPEVRAALALDRDGARHTLGTITVGELMADFTNSGAFTHSATEARQMILALPVHHVHDVDVNANLIDDAALRVLISVALDGLDPSSVDDVELAGELIVHVPESLGATRNEFVNRFYAEQARFFAERFRGPHTADANFWWNFGLAASDSVGQVIDGSLNFLTFRANPAMTNDFARGNAAIFDSMHRAYVQTRRGETVDDPLMAGALAAYEAAARADNRAEAQRLVIQGNALITVLEQTIAQPYVEFPHLPHEELGSAVAMTAWKAANEGAAWIGSGGDDAWEFDVVTADEFTTDRAVLTFRNGAGEEIRPPIRVDAPQPEAVGLGNEIYAASATGIAFDDPALTDALGDPWIPPGETVASWTDWSARVPMALQMMLANLTDPIVRTMPSTYAPPLGPVDPDEDQDD